MPRYRVPFHQEAVYRVVWEVDASSPEEANDLVLGGQGVEVSAVRVEFFDDMEMLPKEIERIDP